MEPTDDELIGRFRRGDDGAFEDLVHRWDRRVLCLAYRLTRDSHDALDVRQAAFLKAHRSLALFNGHARFSTWLHRVVLNLCRDHRRAQESRDRTQAASIGHRPAEMIVWPSPHEVSERNEASRVVGEAIASLPEAEREIVVLRHYQGLGFPEIADVLETPVSTVKSRMAQALARLRVRLRDVDL